MKGNDKVGSIFLIINIKIFQRKFLESPVSRCAVIEDKIVFYLGHETLGYILLSPINHLPGWSDIRQKIENFENCNHIKVRNKSDPQNPLLLIW